MRKDIFKIAQVFPLLLDSVAGNKTVKPEEKIHHDFICINERGLMELLSPIYFTNDQYQEKVTYIGNGEGFRSACMLCYTHKLDVETLIYLN